MAVGIVLRGLERICAQSAIVPACRPNLLLQPGPRPFATVTLFAKKVRDPIAALAHEQDIQVPSVRLPIAAAMRGSYSLICCTGSAV